MNEMLLLTKQLGDNTGGHVSPAISNQETTEKLAFSKSGDSDTLLCLDPHQSRIVALDKSGLSCHWLARSDTRRRKRRKRKCRGMGCLLIAWYADAFCGQHTKHRGCSRMDTCLDLPLHTLRERIYAPLVQCAHQFLYRGGHGSLVKVNEDGVAFGERHVHVKRDDLRLKRRCRGNRIKSASETPRQQGDNTISNHLYGRLQSKN